MNLIHFVLIVLHTIAGTVSFIAGVLVIVLRRTSWLFQTYLWALLAMEATLIAVVSWDWPELSVTTQIMYVALCMLGAYAVIRSFQARQKQAYRYTGWRLEFMDDIGFTLISLFDGFIVVGAIDVGMPIWAAVGIGIVGILVGRKWVQYEKQRYMIDRKRYNERNLRKK